MEIQLTEEISIKLESSMDIVDHTYHFYWRVDLTSHAVQVVFLEITLSKTITQSHILSVHLLDELVYKLLSLVSIRYL